MGLFDPAHFDTDHFDTVTSLSTPLWSAQGYTSSTNVVIAAGATLLLDTINGDCRTLHIQAGGRLLVQQGGQKRITAHGGFGIKVDGEIASENGQPLSYEAQGQYALDLYIANVVEANFVGGDAGIGQDTDPGITVAGAGQINIVGAAKSSWHRASHALAVNATYVDLEETPTNWRVGDDLVISPTQPPNSAGATPQYDRISTTTVLSVVGNRVNFSSPIQFAHPRVNVLEAEGGTLWFGAEVMNLTRNVRIRGANGARSHVIWNRTTRPQTLKFVELDFLGPKHANGNGVMGRYPVHFHHCEDGSIGSALEGLCVRRSGNGGIVQHASHGSATQLFLTHDCIVYDAILGPINRLSGNPPTQIAEPNFGAFWWDRAISSFNRQPTHFVHWRRCGALKLRRSDGNPANTGGTRIHGFQLGEGHGNVLEDCWAAGVWGNTNAAGFNWPEAATANGDGVWILRGFNVAHNCRVSGSFAWTNDNLLENDDLPHIVQETGRMVCYYNGLHGYDQGAYARSFRHIGAVAYGNMGDQYHSHAFCLSVAGAPLEELRDSILDGVGIGAYGYNIHNANLNPQNPELPRTRILNTRVYRVTTARYAFVPNTFESSSGPPRGAWHDVINGFNNVTTVNQGGVQDFYLGNTLHAQSVIRVQDSLHGTLRLRPARLGRPGPVGSTDGPIAGQAGETLNTGWNAWVLVLNTLIYPP